jgi:hypothetical protein
VETYKPTKPNHARELENINYDDDDDDAHGAGMYVSKLPKER